LLDAPVLFSYLLNNMANREVKGKVSMTGYRLSAGVLFIMLSWILMNLSSCDGNQRQDDKAQSNTEQKTAVSADRDSVVIELSGADSLTVLDLLLAGHQVAYKSTAAGVFVTAIDSIKNGGGAYWIYSVNDSLPQVACDRYVTKDGDMVKWHFRKTR